MWDFSIFGFSVYELFWFFVIYSVLGWCTEVVFCTVNTGKWVNRGFLNGPVCPIYGFGMAIVLCVLTPLLHHPFVLFLGGALLTSLLELVTGWVLEKIFKTHWWDYSDAPFNLGGYICLKFSLAWGLGSVIVMRVVHPPVASLVGLLPRPVGELLAWPVIALFLTDFIVTTASLAKFSRDLGKLDEIACALRHQTDLISQNLGDTALDVSARLEDAKEDFSDKLGDAKTDFSLAKADLAGKLDAARDELAEKLDAAKGEISEKLDSARTSLASAKGGFSEKLDAVKDNLTQKTSAVRRQQELQAAFDALSKKQWTARRLFRAYPAIKYRGRYAETAEKLRQKFVHKF